MNLATKYRPKTFGEVVGQESAVDVLKNVLSKGWRPPAISFCGPFGTGKTTLARLLARALLCKDRKGVEPCGVCSNCKAVDNDNHPSYLELDAASQGLVADVRAMKDQIGYRASGDLRILLYDESHMLSKEAQNALLQTLEEGVRGVMFLFCTTDPQRMLPTVFSRCIALDMRLLTATQLTDRLKFVADAEGIKYDDKALRIISTYVRGHARDALQLLDQISQVSDVTEALTRTYLRLDKYVEVYEFLVTQEKKEALIKLEELLCNYAVGELFEIVGQALVNAYKLKLGLDIFDQVDRAWLKRVAEAQGERLLERAERVLLMDSDFASITYGVAALGRVFLEDDRVVRKSNELQAVSQPNAFLRKPGKTA